MIRIFLQFSETEHECVWYVCVHFSDDGNDDHLLVEMERLSQLIVIYKVAYAYLVE